MARRVRPGPVVDTTTRGRLLDAASEVFCERGYERTTVAEVARRAGLTTGAIYANFRDKAELLLKTVERGTAALVAEMEAARSAGVSAADRFVLMARRLVTDQTDTERRLFVEMFAAGRRDPDVGRRVAETLAAMESELARLVDKARSEGDVGPERDPAVIARWCLSVGVGFTHLAVAGLAGPDPADWTELAGQLLSSLRAGAVPQLHSVT